MNNHYIPRLLLKQFAVSKKVNTYDFASASFQTKKLKNTFASEGLFDKELEADFAAKLEGPFGDLLNHRLLQSNTITVDRRENMLMRKFLMVNSLRAPVNNCSWDEMVRRTRTQNHPSVQALNFLKRHHPILKEKFEQTLHSDKTYIPDLKKAMAIDMLEDMADPDHMPDVSKTLRISAQHAIVSVTAFWDSSESGQEFILPKLPGISMMDYVSIFYKWMVIQDLIEEKEKQGWKGDRKKELYRLLVGSSVYSENFSIYPISPTRAMIYFSPYFRAFFPIMDPTHTKEVFPALLGKSQFDRHFFEPMRMELFRPCKNVFNKYYQYQVKQLCAEEVLMINAMLLNMETEEFVFHDFNKIRDSFWYYDKKAKFASEKKHDFGCLV